MRLPRPRYTILSLMVVVLLASLAMTFIVARREQRRRSISLQTALVVMQERWVTW